MLKTETNNFLIFVFSKASRVLIKFKNINPKNINEMSEIGLNIKFNRNLMLTDTCPPLCKFKLYESLLLVYNRAIMVDRGFDMGMCYL